MSRKKGNNQNKAINSNLIKDDNMINTNLRDLISQLNKNIDMGHSKLEGSTVSEFIDEYFSMNRTFKSDNDGIEHTWDIAAESKSKLERKKPIKYWLSNKESKGLKELQEQTGVSISSLIRAKIKDALNFFSNSRNFDDGLGFPDVYKIDEVNKWVGIFTHDNVRYITELTDSVFEAFLSLNDKRKELGLAKSQNKVKQIVKL